MEKHSSFYKDWTTFVYLQALKSCGYNKLVIQRGRGHVDVEQSFTSDFSVESYRYKDTLANDIASAELVISHAGMFLKFCSKQ